MQDWFEQIPIDQPTKQKLRQFKMNWRMYTPLLVLILLLIVLLIFQPWFIVKTGEVGVVLRLGKKNRVVPPGFHFRLPRPIEVVYTPNVQLQRRVEVGFRSNPFNTNVAPRTIPEESIMLTGDENIIVAKMIVHYRIADPEKYLFNVYDVEGTLKDVSEASLRQVIGDYPIESALTGERDALQVEILKIIDEISKQYDMGLFIERVQLQETQAPDPVEPAFADVFNAREDQARIEREAEAYRNKEMPKAEGDVRKILQESEAYRAERIAKAKGEVERFSALLKEFRAAPEVTRQRLYLETLEKVMANRTKVIVDSQENLLKFMNVTPPNLSLFPSAGLEEGRTQ